MRKFIITLFILFSIGSQTEARMYDPMTGRFLTKDPFLTEVPEKIETSKIFIPYSSYLDDCPTCDGGSGHYDVSPSTGISPYTYSKSWTPDKYGPIPMSYARPPIAIDRYGNIGVPASVYPHPYVYVNNNPVNYTDPTGKDIYLQTGNNTGNPVNDAFHQGVCVDLRDRNCCKIGKECFSFGMTGVGVTPSSMTWLGWSSTNLGGPLKGEIDSGYYTGGSITRRHTTTCKQDNAWLTYMNLSRTGVKDTYSALRHNCRLYSQWEFRDAPLHMGPP